MQFRSIHDRGTIDAVFILRRMQEEYHVKGKKLYVSFVDPDKALDRVRVTCTEKVLEWALRKK